MAGNTAVLKPDQQTSFTALWAVRLMRLAGLPADVLPVVTGEGAAIGPLLGERVDYLMFTGSTRTGKLVAGQAADRLIGCSLELGGKNPMIVLEDADLEAAVDGAVRGCFVGAGQVCVSIERIYVHQAIFDGFVERFVARAQAIKIGAAFDYSIDVGSLTSARQLETVEDHVCDAVAKGATVLAAANGSRTPVRYSTTPRSSRTFAKTCASTPRRRSDRWSPSTRSRRRRKPSSARMRPATG